jgi:light-regulated signal transduction histidine kinase (bacteriophytochrome)
MHIPFPAVSSVIRLLLTIGGAVFISEIFVMLVLEDLPLQSEFSKSLADATMLLILLFPVFYFVIFRPFTLQISQHLRAEDELQKLNEQLELRVEQRTNDLLTANQELEAFAHSVSHDLRAPLRALDGYSRLVQETESGQLSTAGREMLAQIRIYSGRMGTLIEDVLQFAQMGRFELRVGKVDMAALAYTVFNEHHAENLKAKVAFGELPHVQGDESMLRQVWANLISNALKYSSKAEHPEISIGTVDSRGQTAFFVKDNGAGFDMAYAGKLFELFRRMHTQDDFPGTGAGLAIAKRIVQRHGGEIWAETQPGLGATFYFTLGGV